MSKKESEYSKGKNPNSLDNLIHEGRPSSEEVYGEPKKKRTISVTESGWQGIVRFAKTSGCSSVSEFLEKLGRGQVNQG